MRNYRGKTKDGKLVKGWYVELYGNSYIILVDENDNSIFNSGELSGIGQYDFVYHEVIPETVGQDTGLKDKNGKKIYKGDIVESKRSGNRGLVFYQEQRGYWEVDCSVTDKYVSPNDDWIDYEVIGNIDDNPELL